MSKSIVKAFTEIQTPQPLVGENCVESNILQPIVDENQNERQVPDLMIEESTESGSSNISMEDCEVDKADEKNRIAVFYANWIESTLLVPGMPNCYFHSWKIRQIVSEKNDIERLISLNAPIKVYIEDGSYRRAEG
jgi:hypothetical protein